MAISVPRAIYSTIVRGVEESASTAPHDSASAASSRAPTYISDCEADERLRRAKAAGPHRGSVGTAHRLWCRLRRDAKRSPTGSVITCSRVLARQLGLKDRNTIGSALTLLHAADLLEVPILTRGAYRRVTGLRLRPIVAAAPLCAVNLQQQDLPLQSSTKSSALRAPVVPEPPKPLTPATMGFVQVAVWNVTNGPNVPDTLPDVAETVRTLLAARGATASEADIRAAMEHVDRQRQRQRDLPLLGVARNPTTRAPRTVSRAAPADRSRPDEYTRRELDEARLIRNRCYGGCPHEPRCSHEMDCLRAIAEHRRGRVA